MVWSTYHNFERIEIRATVFLKWTDFSSSAARFSFFFFFHYWQAQNTSLDYERYFLASGWVCSTRGTATTSESSSTVKANAIRLQKAQYVLSVVAHSGSKWLKFTENKFTRCYFTNFSKRFFMVSHSFGFRSYSLHTEILSNCWKHQ